MFAALFHERRDTGTTYDGSISRQVSLENRSADGRCASCGEDICCGGRGRAGVEKAAATEEAYAGPTAAVLQVVAPLTACGGRFVAKLEDFDVEESDVDGSAQ